MPDMVLAGNTVRKNKGGLAFALNGQVVGELPLPVAGLMSTESAESVEEKLQALKAALKAHGISEDIDAFMTLAFVSLPGHPEAAAEHLRHRGCGCPADRPGRVLRTWSERNGL